jgi:hypothetical protein
MNDETILVNKEIPIGDDTIEDFMYSLGRHYLQEEDVDNYEFVVMSLGDTALYNSTENCYSFIEKGNAVNKVTEIIEDKSKRFLGGRNPIIYSLESEKMCVLEVLNDIMKDENSKLFWDLKTPYNRITQASKSVEDNIKFNRQESGLMPIVSLSVGSEKLNIGVKVKIDGTVEDSVSGLTKEAHIFRDFNVINGGNVNVPYINAVLSDELVDKLNKEGIIELNSDYSIKGVLNIYKLNFVGLKSANKRLLKSMTLSQIVENLKSIADLKCKQWAINQVKKLVMGDKEKVEFSTNLSIEEIEIRKLLRIDENGTYIPERVEKDDTSPFEIYPSVFMTWDIKFPDKKTKEKYLESIKCSLGNFREGDVDVYNKLDIMLSGVKKEIREREFAINCVRIASAMMNKSPFLWEAGLEKDKTATDKILQRNMIVGGKVNIHKKVFNEDIIEQKKWVQLIKTN